MGVAVVTSPPQKFLDAAGGHPYRAEVEHLDQCMGVILDTLVELGIAENTIVFYYGDHGGVLARSKRYVYESGTRVPFIIRIPEVPFTIIRRKIPQKTTKYICYPEEGICRMESVGDEGAKPSVTDEQAQEAQKGGEHAPEGGLQGDSNRLGHGIGGTSPRSFPAAPPIWPLTRGASHTIESGLSWGMAWQRRRLVKSKLHRYPLANGSG